MSYAKQVKEEIFDQKPLRGVGRRWFSLGLLLFSKQYSPEEFFCATEHAAVSKLYSFAVRDLAGTRPELSIFPAARGETVYTLSLRGAAACKKVTEELSPEAEQLSEGDFSQAELHAFLSGVFMACGTVSEPAKGYHMEFLPPGDGLCDLLFELLSTAGYPPKSTVRRKQTVLYYKESEPIEDILTMIGAVNSSLALMETKVYKDLRNRANRATNCETANIDKQVRAARQQVDDIRLVLEHKAGKKLSPELLTLCEVRLKNPEASLSDLAEMLSISRSGVNHRLRRIAAIAGEIRELLGSAEAGQKGTRL
ncbi:MAG TPA: DNA-binding protein WhiA [Candidatus Fimivivens faecavium]|nr:DNA-binding protein WhiA [Candidatus Fimivivens faecavium]